MNRKRTLYGVALLAVLLLQLTPAVAPIEPAAAATYCDWASFVMDVTVPDGTTLAANTPFIKTWRLKNMGTCTWTTAYSVYYVGGDMMGAPPSVPMPNDVPPGATVDISVPMVAPGYAAHFRGNWMLKNAAGQSFGIGSTASNVFWVDINVSTPMIEVYDYAANVCAATWHYNGGPIPCPYKASVAEYGYVKRLENPLLENGSLAGVPGLLTVPQQKYNGVIMGVFPEVDIIRGDRFQALLGCEYNAVDCYVTFELDYLTPQLDLITIWKFREKYDGKFYRADVDLSPIAFKKGIKLVLIVSASGPATGDKALWVAPRLVRPFTASVPTPTPAGPTPTFTPTVTPSPTATLPPATACDKAEFVADVTVPDGTTFAPGQAFTKTWRLKNVGTCTWTPSYSLAFVSGEIMGGAAASALPANVAPGQTVDLSVYLTAPSTSGLHEGSWMLRNTSGGFFGIGASGTSPFWVRINVSGGTSAGYNFVSNLCAATWTSGAGTLPCPGADGDSRGFALPLATVMLENGTTDSRPAFLAAPQAIDYGWVQGTFPSYVVQSGDRFQAAIACQYNASLCDVFYRLDYQIGTGAIQTLWSSREKYDGTTTNVDVSLSSLVGQNVKFILTILSNGASTNDRAMWIEPRILYSSTPMTPATVSPPPVTTEPPTATPVPPTAIVVPPTPTFTATPAPVDPYAGWSTYANPAFGFNFKVPPDAVSGTPIDGITHYGLPIVPNTLLVEKYVEAKVVQGASSCSDGGILSFSETVSINGMTFLKEGGQEGAAGSTYEWVSYSAFAPLSSNCVTMKFVLHSHNAGAYTNPPPPYDNALESAVFEKVMSSFSWGTTYTTGYVPSATFCADPQALTLLQSFETAVKTSDGNLLASIVSPRYGLDLNLWQYGNTVNYNAERARNAFTDATAIDWGVHPGSLLPTIGTFADKVLPTLVDVFAPTREFKCNDPNLLTYTNTWPPAVNNINFYQIYRPATTSVDFDMNYWLVGMEYVNGKLYLIKAVHFIWTP